MQFSRKNVFGRRSVYLYILALQCFFAPYITSAQNAFGYDSAKVYSFLNHDSESCFDFYKDSSFVFVRCTDDACLCIKGTWKEIDNKIIIKEYNRKFNCGLPKDSSFESFAEIFDDTLLLVEEFKGYGKDFKYRKLDYYSIPKFKRFKVKRYISPNILVFGKTFGISGNGAVYVENKYNVKVWEWTEWPISKKAKTVLSMEYYKAMYMSIKSPCHCYE